MPEWSDSLPRALRMRLDGIGSYVTSVLEEKNFLGQISKSNLQRIQMVAFLKTLDEFLQDGTDAAIRAVDAFAELGAEGFQIGSERFERRNDAVMRGRNLSERLRRSIEDRQILAILDSGRSLRDLVIELGRRFRNGRHLG